MIAYISGPITGMVDDNREAFFEAEYALCHAGWYVYNPIRIDDDYPINAATDEEAYRAFASRDLAILIKKMRCEDGDGIVMLDGWRDSPGATAEWRVAMWVGLDVYYSVEEAITWNPKSW